MRMRAGFVLALLGGVAFVATGRGQEEAPPTSTTLAPALQQTTTVQGSMPDLVGRWLALATLKIPGERIRMSHAFWDVTRKDGKLDLMVRFADPPAPILKQMTDAGDANKAWKPTAEDLTQIAAAWDTLPAREAQIAAVETTLSAHDGFDETLRAEPKTKDARWVATLMTTFSAAAAPAIRQVQVYSVTDENPDGWAGTFVSTTIAAAPFPIPITFEGTFQLYRLDGRRSWWQHMLDTFTGCGRR